MFIFSGLLAIICVIFSAVIVFGQQADINGISNPLKTNDLITFISDVLSQIIKVGAVLCVLALVYVGFKYVSAMGNSDKLSKAHSALMNTMIGIALLLGAQVIAIIIKGTVDAITK